MKKLHLFTQSLALAGVVTLITTASHAAGEPRDPRVNARQHTQQKRIGQGVRSGKLTPREAHRLEAGQQGLRREERQFKSDGVLTPAERAKLNADASKASRDIHREKHDGPASAVLPPPPPRPRDPVVHDRQHLQQARIAQGVKSGQLTKEERKSLEQEEKALRQEERQFKSDGQLSAEERAKLKTDLNQVSQDIYNEKHDGETRPARPPAPVPPPRPALVR